MTDNRVNKVAFVDERVKKAYDELAAGRFEEKQLHEWITRALNDLLENPLAGVRIPSRNWPKSYVARFGVNVLFKFDLPKGWRLIYFLKGDKVEVVSIVLEWFDHSDYEERFGYKKK